MSRRGFDDSVTKVQGAVAAALCAIGLALAVVPVPEGEAPRTGAAPAGPRAAVPAENRPQTGEDPILVLGPVRFPAAVAVSRC